MLRAMQGIWKGILKSQRRFPREEGCFQAHRELAENRKIFSRMEQFAGEEGAERVHIYTFILSN